jgi:hypothetical protein
MIYMNRPKRLSRRKLNKAKGGLSESSLPDQMILGTVRLGKEARPRFQPKDSKSSKLNGGHQARVHSDLMFLVMARGEARLR